MGGREIEPRTLKELNIYSKNARSRNRAKDTEGVEYLFVDVYCCEMYDAWVPGKKDLVIFMKAQNRKQTNVKALSQEFNVHNFSSGSGTHSYYRDTDIWLFTSN